MKHPIGTFNTTILFALTAFSMTSLASLPALAQPLAPPARQRLETLQKQFEHAYEKARKACDQESGDDAQTLCRLEMSTFEADYQALKNDADKPSQLSERALEKRIEDSGRALEELRKGSQKMNAGQVTAYFDAQAPELGAEPRGEDDRLVVSLAHPDNQF